MTVEVTPEGLDGWDEPLPLGWRADLPSFPLDALPGTLGRYATALAEATQTPPDMAGGVVLGVVSGCIGGRVRIRARPGWIEPTNLWSVPVLPSGSRKSAVVDAAGSPLLDAEQVLRETIIETRRNAQVEREARTKYATKLLAEASKECDAAMLSEAQKAAAEAEQIVVPPWPQLTVDDSTPEALVSVLAEQGGRVVAISAEAGLFDVLAGGTYSKRSKVETILKAHAGDTIRVNRQMREPQIVRRPALTLISTIQPYALRQLVANLEYAGRGLLQRVLWSLPADNVGYRTVGAPPVADDLAEQYRLLVVHLAVRMGSSQDTALLRLSPPAAAEHLRYETDIEAMLRPDAAMGGSDLLRSWGSKLAGATLRIAAALHAAHEDLDQPVSVNTMQSAVQLAEYYRAHADAALHPVDDQGAADARNLLRWLTERSDLTFRVREIQRNGPRRLRTDSALTRKTLGRLAELGWCRELPAGGWALHPDAAEHLKAGDSGDSGDAPDETAGQEHGGRGDRVSPPVATPGDSARSGVAAGRRLSPRGGDTTPGAVTSGNGSVSPPVAAVATDCPSCGWPYDSIGHRTNCERTHP